MTATTSLRIASLLSWFLALGLGIPCLAAIRSVASGRGIAWVFGYPTYGQGPFERHGLPTTVPLLAGFLAVCILEGVAGYLTWGGHKSGAVLALALLVPGAVYWWGFDLPFPPIAAAIQAILIVAGWSTFS